MPTEASLKNKQLRLEDKKLGQQARIEANKLKQSERESERAERGQITAAALRTFGSAVGGLMKNDPSWYMHYAEGSAVAVNLPQFFANGYALEKINPSAAYLHGLPQAVILCYHNLFGSVRNRNGQAQPHSLFDINQAADRMLSILRSYNSRLNSYPAYDMMQFFYGELELYRLVVRTCRAIKIFALEDAFNPQIRKTLITGLGFDYDDLGQHIADYRAFLSEFITDLNTHLALPGDFPLIDRKLYLDSAVIRDGKGHNAQYFTFYPIEFHKYNETNNSLVPDLNLRAATFSAMVNLFGNIYSTLKNVSYYVSLKADLLDAAKSGLKLFALDASYATTPLVIVDDDQCKEQIMNIRFCPNPSFNNTNASNTFMQATELTTTVVADPITAIRALTATSSNYTFNRMVDSMMYLNQDSDGFLMPSLTLSNSSTAEDFQYNVVGTAATSAISAYDYYNFTKLLNFYKNEVDGGDIFEATRGMYNTSIPAVAVGGYQKIVFTDYSTEIFTFGCIYENGESASTVVVAGLLRSYVSDPLFTFNYKPVRYDIIVHTGNIAGLYPICQFDKVIPLQEGNLRILHSLATKSLFWIAPSITDYSYKGKSSRRK